MPYFKVRLSGTGISYPFVDGSDPAIGFFTTRVVRAPDTKQAHMAAKARVLSDWQSGGSYATGNSGSIPTLVVEESWPIGWLRGVFGRKHEGYTFYLRDD